MSWIQQLIETYDDNQALAGKPGPNGVSDELPPVGHMIVNAQIELTVDAEGNFVQARAIPKEDEPTLIPCTPDSASRTAGPVPHPLHDNLPYVARDYSDYATIKKENPYDLYTEQLKAWVDSPYSLPAIRAVYHYVTHHAMIHDLLQEKILYEESPGKIMEKWDRKKVSAEKPLLYQVAADSVLKSLVRFRVIGVEGKPELWNNPEVQKAWQDYFVHNHEKKQALCYATGQMTIPTAKHNKGIRFPGDGAKLISSNDKEGFTFRGRFDKPAECLSIGYAASQKAMNALRWLIRRQGYLVDKSRVFLAWGRMGVAIPSLTKSTRQLLLPTRRAAHAGKQPNTMATWAQALTNAMNGYRHEFKRQSTSQVNVIILDAATSGRMSICYYDELAGQDFIGRVEKWHLHGMWQQHDYDDNEKKSISFFGVPASKKLLQACYGVNLSDTRLRLETERLFTAIEQGRDFPAEFLTVGFCTVVKQAAVQSDRFSWRNNILEPVCSVVRYHFYHQKEEYSVALDENNTNRSYLFGRLLALADKLELATYRPEERKTRQTNAMRYMEIFADRPATTWRTVQKKLLPYEHRREAYGGKERKLIHKVGSMFDESDFLSDAPLDGRFLLGFYAQEYAIDQEIEQRKREKALREADEDYTDNADGEENA